MVWEWLKLRGPVTSWMSILKEEEQHARRNGTMAKLARDWKSDRNIGMVLAKDLRSIANCRLPSEDRILRDLLRQAMDLLTTVISGVSMLDVAIAVFHT
jgi:hypothetical protein